MCQGTDIPGFHQANRSELAEKVFPIISSNPSNLFEGPDIMFQPLESHFQVLQSARPWKKSPTIHMCQGTDLSLFHQANRP